MPAHDPMLPRPAPPERKPLLARLADALRFHLVDHAILRILWTNLHEIAPGVWRSNQPGPGRLRDYARRGIRTLIFLRGENAPSYLDFEQALCDDLGIRFVVVSLSGRRIWPREQLLALLDALETAERPLVMHCKSGADRAGLASAFYLLQVEGAPIAAAKAMLSPRYLHWKTSRHGRLDQLLEAFEADSAETPMPLRQWIEDRYDPDRIEAAFEAWRARRRPRR